MSSWVVWTAMQLSLLLMTFSGYSRNYVDTDFGPMHYFEAEGSGQLPPAVLIHGVGSQASDLYLVCQGLRPYVRKVIAVDLPGHGLNEVHVEKLSLKQIETSINQGIDKILAHEEPVMLFGNSLGGWQALNYALHNPKKLSALVLVSPAGAPMSPKERARIKRIFLHDSVEQPQTLIPLLFNQTPPFTGVIGDFLRGRFSSPGVKSLLSRFDQAPSLPPKELRKMKMPILMIWGQQDRIFPVELPFFKHSLPKQTQYLEPKAFTHSPYLENSMDRDLVDMIVKWEQTINQP